jgi:hypothetical protein
MENHPPSTPQNEQSEADGTPIFDELRREYVNPDGSSLTESDVPPITQQPENPMSDQAEQSPSDNENSVDDTQTDTELESQIRAEVEAGIVLRGSQKYDQKVYEIADKVTQTTLKRTENLAHDTADAKFAAKDAYLNWRVNGTNSKHNRLVKKSESAIFEFRRQKFARKARLVARRLEGLKGFHNSEQAKHDEAIGLKIDGTRSGGNREKIRNAREEKLQHRINKLIAAEYKFAGEGRKEKRRLVSESEHPNTNKNRREELRHLIKNSRSVEALENMGRKAFIDRVVRNRLIQGPAQDEVIRLINRFAGANRNMVA